MTLWVTTNHEGQQHGCKTALIVSMNFIEAADPARIGRLDKPTDTPFTHLKDGVTRLPSQRHSDRSHHGQGHESSGSGKLAAGLDLGRATDNGPWPAAGREPIQ